MAGTLGDNWMTEIRKGLWAYCILALADSEPCYGYDIVRRLSEVKGLFAEEGTVYRILAKLKADGLLRVAQRRSAIGPPRKYYQTTARGHEEVARLRHFWNLVGRGVNGLVK